MTPLYDHLKHRGYRTEKEHIIIEDVPVQFLPVYNALIQEAVEQARAVRCGKTMTRIVRPEHLIAIMTQTFRPRDKERMMRILEGVKIDKRFLRKVLVRHGLLDRFETFRRLYYAK